MSYYQNQIQQLQHQLQQQMQTPDQVAQAQRVQNYQKFLQTPDGIAANEKMLQAFNHWHAAVSGVPQQVNTSELQAKLDAQQEELAMLKRQIANLSTLTKP